MARAKGSAKFGGRVKGTPNKLTTTVKAEFELVFKELQNEEGSNLYTWGKANPTEFYKLASKLIPSDINAKLSGAVKVNGRVEFV